MPPSMLEVLTTTPGCPDSIMRGTKDSTPLATPKTLTEKHQAQSLASCSQGRPPPPEVTPALLKRRWQAPSVANTSAASASTEAAEGTSVTTPRTSPDSDSSFTACSSTASSTSAMTTRTPSSSRASTMPRPMPAAPPVTTATLPFRSSTPSPPVAGPTPCRGPTISRPDGSSGRRPPQHTGDMAAGEGSQCALVVEGDARLRQEGHRQREPRPQLGHLLPVPGGPAGTLGQAADDLGHVGAAEIEDGAASYGEERQQDLRLDGQQSPQQGGGPPLADTGHRQG